MTQISARLDCVENLHLVEHVHLVEHSTRVGVLLFAVLHRADESQPARNSCPRLPHSVDSRFGLYHVAVVLSFLRSPALQKFE